MLAGQSGAANTADTAGPAGACLTGIATVPAHSTFPGWCISGRGATSTAMPSGTAATGDRTTGTALTARATGPATGTSSSTRAALATIAGGAARTAVAAGATGAAGAAVTAGATVSTILTGNRRIPAMTTPTAHTTGRGRTISTGRSGRTATTCSATGTTHPGHAAVTTGTPSAAGTDHHVAVRPVATITGMPGCTTRATGTSTTGDRPTSTTGTAITP